MTTPTTPPRPVPDAPPPELRFRRRLALLAAPAEIWRARTLVRALAERELRALYKQAALGVAWAVLTPVALMVVLTIFVTRAIDVQTNGAPYALFSYLALVPWNFFSSSVSQGGVSIINQMSLVNKLRCPREVFPLASITVAGVNSLIAAAVLLLLFAYERRLPAATTPLAVIPLVVQVIFVVAVTLVISSVTVYLRDLRHALPILLQLGLFATPVVYGMNAIPADLQILYCLVNPLAPVIDAYRHLVLWGTTPSWGQLAAGAASALVWLLGGMLLFRRLEEGFADVA